MLRSVRGGAEAAASRGTWLAALAVLAAVALHLPAFSVGFLADDYGHQAILRGVIEHPTLAPWSLYDFGTAPPPGSELAASYSAWWIPPDWKVRFFRPLTSLALWLDHALFGSNPLGYHASSLAVYALLCGLVFALYRALGLGPRVAAGGVLVFGADGASMSPVDWIANRNSLLEAVFAVAALLFLARSPAHRPRGALAAALACGVLAVLSKESGIATFALVAAWLLGGGPETGTRIERGFARRGALVALALALLYLALYVAAGYGARTPFYPVPWREPGAFLGRELVALGVAVPVLTTPFPADALLLEPRLVPAALVLGVLFTAWIWRAGRTALRGLPGARFLVIWTLFTLIPQAGSPIGDRVYFVPAIGSAGLIAAWIARAPRPTLAALRSVAAARWSLFLILGAGALSALDLLAREVLFAALAREARTSVVTAEIGPPPPERREALVLQWPNVLAALSPSATWVGEGGDMGVRFFTVQFGRRGLRLRREGERTLRVESLDEPFLDHPFERVLLSSAAPPDVGQRWRGPAFAVEALEVEGRGLRSMRLEFPAALEDPRYRWLTWRDGALRRVDPPAPGAELVIPAAEPLVPYAP